MFEWAAPQPWRHASVEDYRGGKGGTRGSDRNFGAARFAAHRRATNDDVLRHAFDVDRRPLCDGWLMGRSRQA